MRCPPKIFLRFRDFFEISLQNPWDLVKIYAHGGNFGCCVAIIHLLIYLHIYKYNLLILGRTTKLRKKKKHQKFQYLNVLEMNYCTKNFCNSATYFLKLKRCVSLFYFCCSLNEKEVFWLKFTSMNFRCFLRAMDGIGNWYWKHVNQISIFC